MARTLQQIQKQIDELTKEAESIKQREVAEVIERIKKAIEVYGLTAEDLGLGRAARGASVPPQKMAANKATTRGKTGQKAPVKFRDQSGNTWSGRGLQPNWLKSALQAGKKLDDFKV